MKAIRKSDGKVIVVREWRGASDVVYSDPDMNRFYQASDLDFTIYESDQCISVAKLREILITLAEKDTITNIQAIMIINQVKKSI